MRSEKLDHQRLYEQRFNKKNRNSKKIVWSTIVRFFFQKWIKSQDTVLDIGCGYGEFLNNINCYKKIGIDMNPDSKNALCKNIDFHQKNISDLSFIADNSINVVFISNFLEHLESKKSVENLMFEVFRILHNQGQCIVMGPNMRYIPGKYWDFWDHHVPITDKSLAELLGYIGFKLNNVWPQFLPYTTQSRFPQFPWIIRLYLTFPIAWKIFGEQFLIRASKQ